MLKAFKDALENGDIEPSILPDGTPFLLNSKPMYQATQKGFNLSIGRFHAFGDTLRRHDELKLSGSLLETGFVAIKSLLKRIRVQASLDVDQVLDAVGEALVVIDRLEQRRLLGLNIEQLYEIASIFHFGEDEDPGSVDWSINQVKIRAMQEAPNAADLYRFFLNSPIGNYVPLQGLSDTSTLNFLKEEVLIPELLDWTRMLLQSKMNGPNNEMTSIIESRQATLFGLDGLLHSVLSNTSTSAPVGSVPN